jgi:superfamily II DNA/RNA helicase
MNQGARNRTITDMRRGKVRLLVATDVAARGLDVTGISHVINYDLPRFAEDYVHRIGRTGRAGASGVAISLASINDRNHLERIERFIGQSLPHHVIPGLEPTRELRPSPKGPGRRASSGGRKNAGYSGSRRNEAGGGKGSSNGTSRIRKWGSPKASKPVTVEYRGSGAHRQGGRVI